MGARIFNENKKQIDLYIEHTPKMEMFADIDKRDAMVSATKPNKESISEPELLRLMVS